MKNKALFLYVSDADFCKHFPFVWRAAHQRSSCRSWYRAAEWCLVHSEKRQQNLVAETNKSQDVAIRFHTNWPSFTMWNSPKVVSWQECECKCANPKLGFMKMVKFVKINLKLAKDSKKVLVCPWLVFLAALWSAYWCLLSCRWLPCYIVTKLGSRQNQCFRFQRFGVNALYCIPWTHRNNDPVRKSL